VRRGFSTNPLIYIYLWDSAKATVVNQFFTSVRVECC